MQINELLARIQGTQKTNSGWSARCPAHDDSVASLSISTGEDGRLLLHCHAGCTVEAICTSIGLQTKDLFSSSSNGIAENSKIVAWYDYRDEKGELLFQVVRSEPKDFRQRRPKPDGGWHWSVKGVRVIPFLLPRLLLNAEKPVFVAEGEKDAIRLTRLGFVATCNAGGAEKWTAEHAEFLRGRIVIILPDNDDAGRRHAQQVATTLHGVAKSVRILELPDLPLKGDASDWIASGGTAKELIELAKTASEWSPTEQGASFGNVNQLAIATSEASIAKQDWLEIESFDNVELPGFPLEALPPVVRDFVEAESRATQTPADLAGLLVLAVCSATISRRVKVQPRADWSEPVNLFVAVLLDPGNRKSAVFADATRPLRELEAELIETARPVYAREISELHQDELRLKKFERLASEKGDAHARYEAGELAERMSAKPVPALPRLIVDDATSEKLGIILADQGGRIASMSPEGSVFDIMAGMYSKSGMPQFGVYLMGHSGDDLITDRVTRKSVRVIEPALTCAYTMQPAVIKGLADKAAFRGRGLLGRFLYAAPLSWIGRRVIAPNPVPDSTREAYWQTVRQMAYDSGNFGSANEPFVLQLDIDAEELLKQWETEIEAMLADGGEMEVMRDWGAKLAGATLRIAAVLHCIEQGPSGTMGQPTLAAAIQIARYLVPHAEHVLSMMEAEENSTNSDAQYVLRWIERHGRRQFTKTEAQHHGKRRFPKAEDIDSALAELVKRGYIRLRKTIATGAGRPASPSYEVNPRVFEKENSEKRSCNSHNSAERPDNGSNGNIGSASEQLEKANRVQVTI